MYRSASANLGGVFLVLEKIKDKRSEAQARKKRREEEGEERGEEEDTTFSLLLKSRLFSRATLFYTFYTTFCVRQGVKRAAARREMSAGRDGGSARRGVEEGRGTRGRARSVTGGSQNILCADIYAVKVWTWRRLHGVVPRDFGTSGGSSGQEKSPAAGRITPGLTPVRYRTQRYIGTDVYVGPKVLQ